MISRLALTLLALSILICLTAGSASAQQALDWTQLPQMPPPSSADHHPGLAGHFAGVHNDALIIAGGVTFPHPESDRIYHDQIYVLVKDPNEENTPYRWITNFKLDKPLAYGSSVSTDHGILCIGGFDNERTFSDVFLLTWNNEKQQLEQLPLPPLPRTCAASGAAVIGEKVYVAAGATTLDIETATTDFWSLDISGIKDKDKSLAWQPVFPWPGPSRTFPVVTAQHNGTSDCIYATTRKNTIPKPETILPPQTPGAAALMSPGPSPPHPLPLSAKATSSSSAAKIQKRFMSITP
jgi:N-acetylneuraminic acid mutarotase